MKVKFQFNSRSSGQSVPEAISLANSLKAKLENKFYILEFDSPQDKNLQKLYQLVGSLKGSIITLDDGEPINASKFFNTVDCQEKLLCKGLCKHVRVGYYPIDQFLIMTAPTIENGVLHTSNVDMIRYLSNFLEQINENHFKFNKELFLRHAIEETILENQFCDKFEVNKLKLEIEKLPDEIELTAREDMEFGEGEPENLDTETFLIDFFASCEIDNKMTISDMITCSKAISLLTLNGSLTRIHDSDVMIQSNPEVNKVILVKIRLLDVEMENDEDEEPKVDVIKKEKEFFSIKNPTAEVYFQLYDENDSNIGERLKQLQRL